MAFWVAPQRFPWGMMKCDHNTDNSLRVGIIGLGKMGLLHLAHFLKMPDVSVSSVTTSKTLGEARALGVPLGTAVVRVPEDLLCQRELDVVDICSPSYTHFRLSQAAMEEGKAVICEKPIALSLVEACTLVKVSRERNKLLLIGHVLRFSPTLYIARSLVRKGFLGKVTSIFTFRGMPFPTWGKWFSNKDKSGGAIVDLLIHDLDFVQWTLGPVKAIQCVPLTDHDSFVSIRLMFEDRDTEAQVQGGWSKAPHYKTQTCVNIEGERGSFHIVPDSKPKKNLGKSVLASAGDCVSKGEDDPWFCELRHFINCVQGKQESRILPEEALAALALALAARKSFEQRESITLTDFGGFD